MIRGGIYGASGYMGGEVLRILLEHTGVELAWLTSRGDKPVEYFHRNLYGSGLRFIKPEEVTPCDVAFAALPSGEIMKKAKEMLESGTKVTVHFSATYVPITRGILDICHCFPIEKVSRDELIDMYEEFYRNEFFVRIIDLPEEKVAAWQYVPYPWVAAVSGTNYCHIGLDVDERRRRIVVFSVLDSLGKGGAHAAVQNMNLMFGLEETTGLKRQGLHPY